MHFLMSLHGMVAIVKPVAKHALLAQFCRKKRTLDTINGVGRKTKRFSITLFTQWIQKLYLLARPVMAYRGTNTGTPCIVGLLQVYTNITHTRLGVVWCLLLTTVRMFQHAPQYTKWIVKFFALEHILLISFHTFYAILHTSPEGPKIPW